MDDNLVLGIDCGGTHTDAALLHVSEGRATLEAAAKTGTRHDDLPGCIADVLELARGQAGDALKKVDRVTIGTTLEVNALVQDKADRVGLALAAGPGLNPEHFVIGDHYCIVPGGLDHRGAEVTGLDTAGLEKAAAKWQAQGIGAAACVAKFSPRNPAHENEMAKAVAKVCGLHISLGHNLSGRLNFPRRIATAYYNAAVGRIHREFLAAVEKALAAFGISGSFRLLKADGGAMPFAHSLAEPAQSILSGPAASVMGCMAIWPEAAADCSLLLDMGGTTTDMAIFLHGSPIVDREGMRVMGRRTLVRSLASVSIGIGGDSLITVASDPASAVKVGPQRIGPAMAFGGTQPTLLDALNALDSDKAPKERGNVAASVNGMRQLAVQSGRAESRYLELAETAVQTALKTVAGTVAELADAVNSRPIYTLAGLKAAREARPALACLVGGPAACIKERMEKSLGIEASVAPHADVANAIGAALTRPTASLEIYADTGKGELWAPALDLRERISPAFSLDQAKTRALELMRQRLEADSEDNVADASLEITEADLFATLDDYGRGSRDLRVICQAVPGIVATLA